MSSNSTTDIINQLCQERLELKERLREMRKELQTLHSEASVLRAQNVILSKGPASK